MNTLPAVFKFPRGVLPAWAADAGLCLAPQHEYAAPFFHGNALCFCAHCGTEIAGRTFDDLEPMTDEEREQWLAIDMAFDD